MSERIWHIWFFPTHDPTLQKTKRAKPHQAHPPPHINLECFVILQSDNDKQVLEMAILYIKNMVCNRCIMVVQNELDKLGVNVKHIALGEVLLEKELTPEEKTNLDNVLIPLGFEVIDDKKSRTIEKIKNIIIDLVHRQDNETKNNLSDVLSKELHHDYNYLSNLFSEVEGTTIEKYLIAQKIERVKELLVYDELSLSEIAFRLNYSSVGYLSSQFKKVTGLTPSHFKQIKEEKRKPLDKV